MLQFGAQPELRFIIAVCFIAFVFYYFQCFVEQKWFHLIGIICGLAIYNSTVVDLPFPLALYKKLLDVSPTLDDLKELSPTEARSVVLSELDTWWLFSDSALSNESLVSVQNEITIICSDPSGLSLLCVKQNVPMCMSTIRWQQHVTVLHNASIYCGGGVPLWKGSQLPGQEVPAFPQRLIASRQVLILRLVPWKLHVWLQVLHRCCLWQQ